MGGRGASFGSGAHSVFYKRDNGRVYEIASASEKNMRKFGLNPKEYMGSKSLVRELNGKWEGSLNDKSVFMFGKRISAKQASVMAKRAVSPEQRIRNNELKQRLTAKRNGTAYTFKHDDRAQGKRGRTKLSVSKRSDSLAIAYDNAKHAKREVNADIGFNQRFTGKKASNRQLSELNKIDRKLKGIQLEAKKYGIKL